MQEARIYSVLHAMQTHSHPAPHSEDNASCSLKPASCSLTQAAHQHKYPASTRHSSPCLAMVCLHIPMKREWLALSMAISTHTMMLL